MKLQNVSYNTYNILIKGIHKCLNTFVSLCIFIGNIFEEGSELFRKLVRLDSFRYNYFTLEAYLRGYIIFESDYSCKITPNASYFSS